MMRTYFRNSCCY